MKKKLSWFFLQYGQISCVSNEFLVGSVIWDNTEYFLTFQRQYVCIVSGKWDNTNTVFLGIQILRRYSVLGDTRIISPLLHRWSRDAWWAGVVTHIFPYHLWFHCIFLHCYQIFRFYTPVYI
jgi:hypothetical protein